MQILMKVCWGDDKTIFIEDEDSTICLNRCEAQILAAWLRENGLDGFENPATDERRKSDED